MKSNHKLICKLQVEFSKMCKNCFSGWSLSEANRKSIESVVWQVWPPLRETLFERKKLKKYAKRKDKSAAWLVRQTHIGCSEKDCRVCKGGRKRDKYFKERKYGRKGRQTEPDLSYMS